MAFFSIKNTQIAGLAACVPKQIAYNKDYEWITEKERKMLIKTTGIEQRRMAADGQCASDFCVKAAEDLLTALAWNPADVDVLVFVSQTPDYITPATSMLMQERLGISTHCLCFDINLGCSAYVYGLSVVASMLASTGLQKALLLVGDTSSDIVSEQDKSTAPLFSDAGSATALSYAEGAPEMHFNLQSDGKGYEAIIIKDGGARHRLHPNSLVRQEHKKGVCRNDYEMAMDGLRIFNFALREVVPNVKKLLADTQTDLANIDYTIFHQANRLLNETIRKKLKLPPEKVPYSLKEFGNTSAATIPVTLVTQLSEALTNRPLSLLLSGFGVGLSWGSVLVQTEALVCLPLIEM